MQRYAVCTGAYLQYLYNAGFRRHAISPNRRTWQPTGAHPEGMGCNMQQHVTNTRQYECAGEGNIARNIARGWGGLG